MIALLLGLACAQDLSQGAAVQFGTPSKDWGQGIQFLASSPDGKRVVTVRRNGEVREWDVDSAKPGRTYVESHKNYEPYAFLPSIEEVVFTPDGKHLVGGGFRIGLRAWSVSTGEVVWKHEHGQSPLAISADGRTLVHRRGFQGDIDVWNFAEKELVATIEGHKQSVNALDLSPDGKALYSCSMDLTVRKWDLATGKELWRIGRETEEKAIGPTFPQHLRVSPNGNRLLVTYHGCWELGAAFLNAESGKEVARLDVQDSDGLAVLSKDNLFAIQGKGGRPTLVSALTGRTIARGTIDLKDRIFSMAFTPDGKHLLSTRDDGTFLSWDLSKFEKLQD